MWWFFGFLCAFLFGSRGQAQMQPEYGVRARPPAPPPPLGQPAVGAADQEAAATLVTRYLGPVESPEPTVAEAVEAGRLLSEIRACGTPGAFDDARAAAATEALVRIGPAALGALRREAADPQSLASGYAQIAVQRIEAGVQATIAAELRGMGWAGQLAVQERLAGEHRAMEKAREEAAAARRAGLDAEAERAWSEFSAAQARAGMLAALGLQLAPPPVPRPDRPTAKYGVRPKYGAPRPRPPAPDPADGGVYARYGVRIPRRGGE